MKSFRIKKLEEAISIQSKIKKEQAVKLAEDLEKSVNWEHEFNYQIIVMDALEERGLLRSQNEKSCRIRRGTKLK